MSQMSVEQLLCIDNQVCFSLYRAANAMVRAYRPLLDSLDLTYPQYLAMLVLWQNDGASVKYLGEKLHLDSGTLTPLLKRLEAKGLLKRGRSEQDERVRVIELTDAGLILKQQAAAVPEQMFCQLGVELTLLAELKRLCDQVTDSLFESA
ncbi:MarR family transcriptional regulator [Shewanella avicenniae]|uniref:MarR family transcriptional regulator n=1 Tax=Shewanella avicenniae TaxID=2814294 RepID=A0ABX7QQN0_9GAMM|nr:MarR family transcriptional regulator [Shewanella avicenniae]QSX33020.1 MarR family transcriptional regulator [Shewanella avicenniae]